MEDPRIGQVLDDRFRIVQRLAAGGTGVVYRAEELETARAVAVKFLHESTAESTSHRGRFEREAAAMSRLTHPNLASIIGYGTAGARPYLVMEMVEGESLRRRLQAGPLSPRRAVAITRQILTGLASAHQSGVVHRDLKPGNVTLTQNGGEEQVKILDFGVAKLLGGSSSTALSVVTGKPLGTPEYMSPEQAKAEAVDSRADLYSVGVILYEMVVGRRPFAAETGFALLRQHVEDDPRAPRRLAPHLSAELEAVILRAMSKDPAWRWQSAAEMDAALGAVPEAASAEPGAGGPSRGRWWRFAAAALTLLAVAAGGAWLAVVQEWIAVPVWVPWPDAPIAAGAGGEIAAFTGADAGVTAAAEPRDRSPPPPPWSPPPATVRLAVEPAPPSVTNRGTRGRLAGRRFAPRFVRLIDGEDGRAVQFSAAPPERPSPCAADRASEEQRSLVISLPARGAPAFAESKNLSNVRGATIEVRADGEATAVEGRWSLELTRVDIGAGIARGRIRLRARGGTRLRGRFRAAYCPDPRAYPTDPPKVNGAVWAPDRAPAPDDLPAREAAGAFGAAELHPVHANLHAAGDRDGWILSFFAEAPADPCAELGRLDVGVAVLLPPDVLHADYELSALLDGWPVADGDAATPRVALQPAPELERRRPRPGTADILALRIDAVTDADVRGRLYVAAADRRRSLFTGAFRAVDCRR